MLHQFYNNKATVIILGYTNNVHKLFVVLYLNLSFRT